MSLKDKHPVRAIEAVLDELKVGKDPSTDGFRSSGFLWFTEGTQGTFRVSNSESDGLYWRDYKDGVDNLTYTGNRALAAVLEFIQT